MSAPRHQARPVRYPEHAGQREELTGASRRVPRARGPAGRGARAAFRGGRRGAEGIGAGRGRGLLARTEAPAAIPAKGTLARRRGGRARPTARARRDARTGPGAGLARAAVRLRLRPLPARVRRLHLADELAADRAVPLHRPVELHEPDPQPGVPPVDRVHAEVHRDRHRADLRRRLRAGGASSGRTGAGRRCSGR